MICNRFFKAELPFIHIQAHIQMKKILSLKQVKIYDELRVYQNNKSDQLQSKHRHKS